MSKTLPPNPNMDYLRKEAKDLLEAFRAHDPAVLPVIRHLRRLHDLTDSALLSSTTRFLLSDAQLCLAAEYGFKDWGDMKAGVEGTKGKEPQFKDIEELSGFKNAWLQILFREVYDWDLALVASSGSSQLRKRLFDNMTDRHQKRLQELPEIRMASPADIKVSRENILQIASDLADMGVIGSKTDQKSSSYYRDASETRISQDRLTRERFVSLAGTKPASQRSNAELIPLFRALADIGRTIGIVTLDKIADEFLDEELLRYGAKLAADCTEPETLRNGLTARRDALLAQHKKRLDMTVIACEKICGGDSPNIVEEICRPFV